ncbi:MAG: Hsp20/alpha crystallin family protein [Nitrospirota bacterium]
MAKKTIVPVQKQSLPARREEWNPFSLLRQEMNSLFDNFFRGFETEPFESRLGAFSPRVDVAETDKEIKVTVELPGMDDKDIDVSLTKDMLTIRGEKKEEKEEKSKSFYRMERSYGSFSRTVPLPTEIDTNKVKAEFKKGILSVTLPKTQQAIKETKKIQVKAE